MVPAFFKVLVQRFLVLLAAYTVTRVLFLVWNWSLFASSSTAEIGEAFVRGLRFDTSAILLTNALGLLLWMLPARAWRRAWLNGFDLLLFAVVNWICLGSSIVDAEFVKFIGKRSGFDMLSLHGDMEQQSSSLILRYWYLCAAVFFLTGLVLWASPKFKSTAEAPSQRWWQEGVWRLVAVGLIFTGMRGGYGFKPLNPMQAYFSTKRELGLLTLNTPFNVIKTHHPSGTIQRDRYFERDQDALQHLKQMTDLSRPPLALAPNWNVVILIIESFGMEYTGAGNTYRGYTPQFDALAKKGQFFPLAFANARRSIEGIPAVFCGLPSLMDEPIITSDFSSDRLDCLPKILAAHGYSSYFLHGAHNGSMHFDSFSRVAGFENFVGLDEYPKTNPEDIDPNWGVLDEPMLQYAIQTIDHARKPTFLGLFTLSSHFPYFIPPAYRGKFPKGHLEIHESIGYTDYAIGRFFEEAKTKPWFKNTIFVITADHTQKSEYKEYQDLIGNYRVPILFYVPGLEQNQMPYDRDRIVQHIDIVPSVLDLLGLTVPDRLLVGQSVFDLNRPGHAYNFNSFSYWYMDANILLDFAHPPTPLGSFRHTKTRAWQAEASMTPEVREGLLNLKSVLHYINEGLTHNSLYNWRDHL